MAKAFKICKSFGCIENDIPAKRQHILVACESILEKLPGVQSLTILGLIEGGCPKCPPLVLQLSEKR